MRNVGRSKAATESKNRTARRVGAAEPMWRYPQTYAESTAPNSVGVARAKTATPLSATANKTLGREKRGTKRAPVALPRAKPPRKTASRVAVAAEVAPKVRFRYLNQTISSESDAAPERQKTTKRIRGDGFHGDIGVECSRSKFSGRVSAASEGLWSRRLRARLGPGESLRPCSLPRSLRPAERVHSRRPPGLPRRTRFHQA